MIKCRLFIGLVKSMTIFVKSLTGVFGKCWNCPFKKKKLVLLFKTYLWTWHEHSLTFIIKGFTTWGCNWLKAASHAEMQHASNPSTFKPSYCYCRLCKPPWMSMPVFTQLPRHCSLVKSLFIKALLFSKCVFECSLLFHTMPAASWEVDESEVL